MKRLRALCVMLLVLWISAQAYGNVLVYNLYGSVQTVDTAANAGDTKVVLGYMVMDVNVVSGTADESSVVLYGRAGRRNRVYTIYDDVVNLAKYGNFVTVMIDTGTGNSIIMTGRIRALNIGSRRAPFRLDAASALSGAMSLQGGQLFDLSESLIGAGAMQASLNNQLTRTAYSSPDGVAEAVDSILTNLEARGYHDIVEDEEPTIPDEPGDDGGALPS
jgi:hypothetical protein